MRGISSGASKVPKSVIIYTVLNVLVLLILLLFLEEKEILIATFISFAVGLISMLCMNKPELMSKETQKLFLEAGLYNIESANNSSEFDKIIYGKGGHSLDIQFNTGISKIPEIYNELAEAAKNGCKVRIALTNPTLACCQRQNRVFGEGAGSSVEARTSLIMLKKAYNKARVDMNCFEVFLCDFYPSGSIEIVDKTICRVVRYLPGKHSQSSYFEIFKRQITPSAFDHFQEAFDYAVDPIRSFKIDFKKLNKNCKNGGLIDPEDSNIQNFWDKILDSCIVKK